MPRRLHDLRQKVVAHGGAGGDGNPEQRECPAPANASAVEPCQSRERYQQTDDRSARIGKDQGGGEQHAAGERAQGAKQNILSGAA